LILHKGDILDPHCSVKILSEVRPKEIYHLAAQSHVTSSFEIPEYTFQVNVFGTLNLLQALRLSGIENTTRLYNAATSELFGGVVTPEEPLNESSPFMPKSPYAISKLAAYWLVRNYRASYGIFAVNGILFNHESPRRGIGFVTKRIARAVAKYKLGIAEKPLTLAGLDMARDWGHAADYVHGMWLMLQQDEPRDFVLATGTKTTVREFVEAAFQRINITVRWQGIGADLKGINVSNGETVVSIDQNLIRASEVECLVGDSRSAMSFLNWKPLHSLEELVGEMVDSEVTQLMNKRKVKRKIDTVS